MIGKLASLYSINFSVKTFLPLVASVVGKITAKELLKFIPVIGNVINATVAGVFTAAMALYCIDSFEKIAIKKAQGKPCDDFKFETSVLNEYIKNMQTTFSSKGWKSNNTENGFTEEECEEVKKIIEKEPTDNGLKYFL